jgi:ERF superfamily
MTEHRNVYAALAAAQSEMDAAVKGSVNPAFKSKYADLADVVQACRAALNKHGMAFFHQMVSDGGQLSMSTVLAHGASDTMISCDVPLIVSKNDMQGMKSATTYAKRIGLESLTGIAPEDDDGNAAAKAPPKDADPSSTGLRDAWRDAVEDGLPENATPRQKAEAYAKAIAADFDVKKVDTLAGRWKRHAKIIDSLQERFPDLHEMLVDAYENQMMAIAPPTERNEE